MKNWVEREKLLGLALSGLSIFCITNTAFAFPLYPATPSPTAKPSYSPVPTATPYKGNSIVIKTGTDTITNSPYCSTVNSVTDGGCYESETPTPSSTHEYECPHANGRCVALVLNFELPRYDFLNSEPAENLSQKRYEEILSEGGLHNTTDSLKEMNPEEFSFILKKLGLGNTPTELEFELKNQGCDVVRYSIPHEKYFDLVNSTPEQGNDDLETHIHKLKLHLKLIQAFANKEKLKAMRAVRMFAREISGGIERAVLVINGHGAENNTCGGEDVVRLDRKWIYNVIYQAARGHGDDRRACYLNTFDTTCFGGQGVKTIEALSTAKPNSCDSLATYLGTASFSAAKNAPATALQGIVFTSALSQAFKEHRATGKDLVQAIKDKLTNFNTSPHKPDSDNYTDKGYFNCESQ